MGTKQFEDTVHLIAWLCYFVLPVRGSTVPRRTCPKQRGAQSEDKHGRKGLPTLPREAEVLFGEPRRLSAFTLASSVVVM